jgi:hypothetical protein
MGITEGLEQISLPEVSLQGTFFEEIVEQPHVGVSPNDTVSVEPWGCLMPYLSIDRESGSYYVYITPGSIGWFGLSHEQFKAPAVIGADVTVKIIVSSNLQLTQIEEGAVDVVNESLYLKFAHGSTILEFGELPDPEEFSSPPDISFERVLLLGSVTGSVGNSQIPRMIVRNTHSKNFFIHHTIPKVEDTTKTVKIPLRIKNLEGSLTGGSDEIETGKFSFIGDIGSALKSGQFVSETPFGAWEGTVESGEDSEIVGYLSGSLSGEIAADSYGYNSEPSYGYFVFPKQFKVTVQGHADFIGDPPEGTQRMGGSGFFAVNSPATTNTLPSSVGGGMASLTVDFLNFNVYSPPLDLELYCDDAKITVDDAVFDSYLTTYFPEQEVKMPEKTLDFSGFYLGFEANGGAYLNGDFEINDTYLTLSFDAEIELDNIFNLIVVNI